LICSIGNSAMVSIPASISRKVKVQRQKVEIKVELKWEREMYFREKERCKLYEVERVADYY